jgi:hypothetical protein
MRSAAFKAIVQKAIQQPFTLESNDIEILALEDPWMAGAAFAQYQNALRGHSFAAEKESKAARQLLPVVRLRRGGR